MAKRAPSSSFVSLALLCELITGCSQSSAAMPADTSAAGSSALATAGAASVAAVVAGHSGTASAVVSGAAAPAMATAALPCDVAIIIEQHCVGCHDTTPKSMAPMALVTWDDFMLESKAFPGLPVYIRAIDRTKNPDKRMPPPPMAPLTPREIAILDAWAAAGTPKNENPSAACAATSG